MSDERPEELLTRLDACLRRIELDADAMRLSELDGFLAGIVISPERIEPEEWLPFVWGEGDPGFDDARQAEDIVRQIMELHDDIVRQLERGDYSPVFDVEPDGEIIWELWAAGFHKAMGLRPDAWLDLAEQGEEVGYAMLMLGRLGALAALPPAEYESIALDQTLEDNAPDLVPDLVQLLHGAVKAKPPKRARERSRGGAKVGRNDPCPCGSGKKYKKCCLN